MVAEFYCALCECREYDSLDRACERNFLRCAQCSLIQVEPHKHLSEAEEKLRYEKHDNRIEDPGYRAHLLSGINPLLSLIKKESRGLDYGSGPFPAVSHLFREFGIEITNYDIYFQPIQPQGLFDFITCFETVEHFRTPAKEFNNINSLLKPGGYLSLMTELCASPLKDWWYARDLTHIVFYSELTLSWISKRFNWSLISSGPKVHLFRKAQG